MFSTMTSIGRSGARLLRSTVRLLDEVKIASSPASVKEKPKAKPVAAKRPQAKLPIATLAFSPNPGALVVHSYLPPNLPPNAPLVVLLHGCGQDAEDFATATGWRRLADRLGVALLMPGQTEANNGQRCFNWFRPGDTGRDLGEAGSIAAMVKAAIPAWGCDPARVFVTGLSAGGAMTACLLASYPDLFAGGAVVAGLPAGSATGVVGAMTRMSGRGSDLSAADWLARARALAPMAYAGPWPRLQVWCGDADTTVAPINATQLALQWTTLRGIATPAVTRTLQPGVLVEDWGDVQLLKVAGMGHVYPDGQPVAAAPEIARFWGISP